MSSQNLEQVSEFSPHTESQKFESQQAKAIRYDLAHLRQEFFESLNDFFDWLQTEEVRNAVGKQLLKQLRTQGSQIRARLEADFSLVVIGDFKRGKSTLINALLEAPVVTTNVTAETVTINQITYGTESRIDACLVDGGRVRLEPKELNADQLVPILERLPQKVSHLSVEAPVKWLQGLRLVDTPGTGDILKRFDRTVHAYLSQADAVLFVVSSLAPLAESEQAFLRLSVLPQDFPKVFFIVNMLDSVRTDQEAERLLNSIQAKISRLFPSAHLFGLSALDEFCRIQSLPRPLPNRASALEAEFRAFRECLQQSVLLNRDLIQLDRAADQTEQMLQEFESNIILLCNAMQADQLRLGEAIAQCEDQTSELYSKIDHHKKVMRDEIQEMCEQAGHWMNDFMDRLEMETIGTILNFKVDDIQRHFHFFLTDSLRKAVSKCLDTHQPAIIESANKAKKEIFEDFQLLTDASMTSSNAVKATFGDLPWTSLDTVGVLIGFSGIGVVIEIIGQLFVSQEKKSRKSRQAVDYQKRLRDALPELRLSVAQEIRSRYSSIVTKIEQQIQSAYQQHIEASLSAMQRAQEICAEGGQKVAVTNECLQEVLSLLASTRLFLNSFKQQLWTVEIQ